MSTNRISNIRRVSIVLHGCPTLERRFYMKHPTEFNLTNYCHNHSSKFKSSTFKVKGSSDIDRNRLVAAVLTFGLNDWDNIASFWFPGTSIESLLVCWEGIKDNVPQSAIPERKSWFDPTLNRNNPFENVKYYVDTLSQKKIRELEALEERKLFGKTSRNIHEQELIHRAYLAGMNHFRDILALNATGDKEFESFRISFASIYVSMEKIDIHDIDQSMRQMSRTFLSNVPKVVMNLTNEEVLSPMKSVLIENDEEQSKIDVTRQTIDFCSGQLLHVIPIIKEAWSIVTEASLDHLAKTQDFMTLRVDDEILKEFYSPPLKEVSIGVSVESIECGNSYNN